VEHIPVLLSEVIDLLKPQQGERVLDVTLGLGGHASAFLERIGSDGEFIGLDTDEENLRSAEKLLDVHSQQLKLMHENFRDIRQLQLPEVDVIFADLGLSSPHIDDPQRGFTFRNDAPLDLRFDRTKGQTVAELIAASSEQELTHILRVYGEVRQARKLALAMKEVPMETTFNLKECVERICGYRAPSILPQVFQALRIAVNDELDALKVLLEEGPRLLKSGGRIGVISYHSLEDRMVKQAFRALVEPRKNEQTGAIEQEADFILLTKKPIRPSAEEIERNPRSRSARFRVLLRR